MSTNYPRPMTPQVPHVRRPSCQVRARVSSQRNVLLPSPGQHNDCTSLDLVSFGSATRLVTCFQIQRGTHYERHLFTSHCEVKWVTETCTNAGSTHLENHPWVKHLTQTWLCLNSLLNNNLKRWLPENSEALVETSHAFV